MSRSFKTMVELVHHVYRIGRETHARIEIEETVYDEKDSTKQIDLLNRLNAGIKKENEIFFLRPKKE